MPVEHYLYCPTCAGSRPVEQPPCLDGHGAQCPERACVDCGTALLVPTAAALVAVSRSAPRTSRPRAA
jgi:hypothetical protein